MEEFEIKEEPKMNDVKEEEQSLMTEKTEPESEETVIKKERMPNPPGRKKKRTQPKYTDADRVTCDECGISLRHKSAIGPHFRKKHSQSADYSCPQCPAKFSYLQYLRYHVKSKHTQYCYKCNKTIPDTEDLAAHMADEEQHTQLCPICGFKSQSSVNLRHHISKNQ